MPDDLDRATAWEELHRETALRNRARPPAVQATGLCLNCDTPLAAGRRWCDADCRDDWQANQPA